MKRLLTLFFTLVAALAMVAGPVDRNQAARLAARYMKNGGQPTLVARGPQRAPSANSQNAPLYIFSRGEGQGFVIVSGDDSMPAILGIVESGDYDEANMAPALLDMINGWSEIIVARQAQGNAPAMAPRKAAHSADIAPMVTTQWSQNAPYNQKCPVGAGTSTHAMTGCVPTAMAQVVYYWYKKGLADNVAYLPASVNVTTEKYNNAPAPITDDYVIAQGTPYNWGLMTDTYDGNSTAESKDAVATLMATIGLGAKVVYRTSSTSGALTSTIPVLRDQFNLRAESKVRGDTDDAAWAKILIGQLTKGRPVAYGGVGSMGGHAFVCDGYRMSDDKFHFNFGWGGASDGYFAVTNAAGSCGGFWQSQQILTVAPESIAGAGDFTTTFTTTPFVYGQQSTITVTVKNNQDPNNLNSTNASGLYVLLSPYEPDVVSQYTTKLYNDDFEANLGADEPASATFHFTPGYHTTYNVKVTDNNGLLLYSGTIPMTDDEAGADAPALPETRPYVLNNFDDLTNGDIFTIVANNVELERGGNSRGYLTYNSITHKLMTADFIASGDKTTQQFAIIKDGEGEEAVYYLYNVKSHKFVPTGTFAEGAMGLLTIPNGSFSFENVSGLPNHWYVKNSTNYLMTSASRQVYANANYTQNLHGSKWFIESVGKLSEADLAAALAAIDEYKNPSAEPAVDVTIDLYRNRGTFYANADCTGASKDGSTFTTSSSTLYKSWRLNPAGVTDANGNAIPGDLAITFSSTGANNAVGYFIQSSQYVDYWYNSNNTIAPISIQTSKTPGGFNISVPDGYYIFSYDVKVKTSTNGWYTTFTTASGGVVTTANPGSIKNWTIADALFAQSTSFTSEITGGSNYNASTAASTVTTANVTNFQVRVMNRAGLKNTVREAIEFDMPIGVGYPKTTSQAYTDLIAAKEVLQTALNADDYATMATVLANFETKKNAYLDCDDVMLPETEAKVYTISLVKSDGLTKYRLRYDESSYTLAKADNAPIGSEFFYAYDAGDGKIAFRNFDNRWLVIKNGRGVNSQKGYLDTRNDTNCGFSVSKLSTSGEYVTLSRELCFGMLAMSARTDDTHIDYFIMSDVANPAFGNSGAPYFNGSYTSAIVFEEVSEADRKAGMPTMTGRFHTVYGDDKCGDLDAAASDGDAAAYFNALEDLADIKFTFSYVDEADQPVTDVRIIAEGGKANNEEHTVQWKATSVKLMGKDYQLYTSYKFVVGSNEYATWAALKAAYPTPENVGVKVVFGAKTGFGDYEGRYYTIRNKNITNRLAYYKHETDVDKVGSAVKARPLTRDDLNYVFRFEDAGDGRYYIYSVGGDSYAKRFNRIGLNTACEMTPSASKNVTDNAYRITNVVDDTDASIYGIVAASDIDNPLPLLTVDNDASRKFWHVNTLQANGSIIRWNVNGEASRWYIEEVEIPIVTITSITSDEGAVTDVTLAPTNSDAGLAAHNKILSWTTALAFGGDYAYHRLTGASLTVGGTTTTYTTAADFYAALNALTQDATATLTISNRYSVTNNYVLGGTTKTFQNSTTETIIGGTAYTAPASPNVANYTLDNKTWTDGEVIADDVVVNHNYRLTNIPFQASTLESDGSFGSGMKWYMIYQQNTDGYWAYADDGTITANTAEANKLATLDHLRKNTWAFVSDGNLGYNIYNYHAGTTKRASAGAYNTNVVVEAVGTANKSQSFVPGLNTNSGAFALFVGGSANHIDRSGGKPLVWTGNYSTSNTTAQRFGIVAITADNLRTLANSYLTSYAAAQLTELNAAIASVDLAAYFAAIATLDATEAPIAALNTKLAELGESDYRDAVGYLLPTEAYAQAMADAKSALAANDIQMAYEAKLALDAAVAAGGFSVTNVKMPEDGHAYRMGIMNASGQHALEYLKFNVTNGNVTELGHTASKDEATVFICRLVDRADGSQGYMFVDTDYKAYLIWRANANNGGHNSDKGFWAYDAANYNATDCALRLKPGQDAAGGNNFNKGPVGTFHVYGYRNTSGNESAFSFAYTNNAVSGWACAGATNSYYNANFSSALKFEEVETAGNEIVFKNKMNNVGYVTTFSAQGRTVLPEGVKAYWAKTVTVDGKKTVNMCPVSGEAIPANQGVVLVAEFDEDLASGTTATMRMLPAAAENPDDFDDNRMVASGPTGCTIAAGEDAEGNNSYVLAKGKPTGAAPSDPSIVGFFRVDAERNLGANKAYLKVSAEYETTQGTGSNVRRALNMFWGDMPGVATGIEAAAEAGATDAYDLSGRKVNMPQRGLYIVNGKKVSIK